MHGQSHTPAFLGLLLFVFSGIQSITAEPYVAGLPSFPLASQETAVSPDPYVPEPPELQYAQAAALLDYETGTLLYGYHHTAPWAPASLTKIVTLRTALLAAGEGRFELKTPQAVHPEAWASAMAPGSSLMFLGPDQFVNGEDLFRGLMVSSGNDAATEVALRVSGSVSQFSREMNEIVREAGFPEFYFEEPAGLSPANRITAEGFARFSALVIREWPQLLSAYTSLSDFTYPQPYHYPGGIMSGSPIRQLSRNGLLRDYPGTDGLKTGFIDESGYNIAVTAQRNGRRLIAVVLGVQGDSHLEGGRKRDDDAQRLLDFGFDSYRRVSFVTPEIPSITVWGGIAKSVLPVTGETPDIVIPREGVEQMRRTVELPANLWAPLAAGDEIGAVRYYVEDALVAVHPLYVAERIEASGFLSRSVDRLRWVFSGN